MDEMLRYEVLFLAVPEITSDEISAIELSIEKSIKGGHAVLISFERWGKYRLAYPIRKNEYGVYFLVRFEVAHKNRDNLFKEIEALFTIKYNEIVMRSMVNRLEADQSLAYQRPDSLEEAPTRDVESFLKETKAPSFGSRSSQGRSDYEDMNDEHVEGTV
jgi:small subunit ribosomal protein S6